MFNFDATKPLKLMIIGVNGQVGWQLYHQGIELKSFGPIPLEILPVARSGTAITLDFEKPDLIESVISECRPTIVINAAAFTAVDRAESEPEKAFQINAVGPGILAESLKRNGGFLIHYSTDYVFDGTSDRAYLETDLTQPINTYGKSKLAGEQAIQAVMDHYLILRTSWVYDIRGKNFLLTMLKLANECSQVKVVADQIGSPTSARLIAAITYQVLGRVLTHPNSKSLSGIYHLTAQGFTSWYGFASQIFDYLAQIPPKPLAELLPIPTTDYPTPAQRPAFSGLNCEKLMDVFGVTPPAWDKELKQILNSQAKPNL